MPKYTNTGTSLVVVGSIRIEPGQTVDSRIWLSTPLPAGISKLSDIPFHDSVILSQLAAGTIAVPASVTGNYKITVFCTTTGLTIKTDSSSAVARILAIGQAWEAICLSRTIDSLIFSGGAGYLTIEKI
jgi:hypothetical protein